MNAERKREWMKVRARLLPSLTARTGGRCFYCGKACEEFTADHMIPVSRGGSDDQHNLAASCFTCNAQKRALTAHEFYYYMVSKGRAPWFGSDKRSSRDWLLVCTPGRLTPPRASPC